MSAKLPEVLELSAFCQTGSGGTPSRSNNAYFEDGTIPWVKSGELKARFVERAEESITQEALNNSATKLVPSGALLVAMYGATVGEVSELKVDAATNQAICHIIPDASRCDRNYLFHFLTAKKSDLLERRVGGAQPNISQGIIKSLKVPLPPLPEQRRIAAILDKADALRAKRRLAIAKLDQLLQSVFLEMFGDEVTTNAKYPSVALPETYWFQEGPGIRKWQFQESGIKLLNVGNIEKDGAINLAKTDRHISAEEATNKYSHFLVDEGDLVIASSGISFDEDGMLRTRGGFVRREHLPLCMNTSTIRFKPIGQKSSLKYLQAWIGSKGFRAQITRLVTGSAQQNFGPSHLRQLTIPLPPVDEQNRFERFAQSIDIEKVKHQRSLEEIELLFGALQKSSFSGELQ